MARLHLRVQRDSSDSSRIPAIRPAARNRRGTRERRWSIFAIEYRSNRAWKGAYALVLPSINRMLVINRDPRTRAASQSKKRCMYACLVPENKKKKKKTRKMQQIRGRSLTYLKQTQETCGKQHGEIVLVECVPRRVAFSRIYRDFRRSMEENTSVETRPSCRNSKRRERVCSGLGACTRHGATICILPVRFPWSTTVTSLSARLPRACRTEIATGMAETRFSLVSLLKPAVPF